MTRSRSKSRKAASQLLGSYTFSLARTPVDLNIIASELKLNDVVVRAKNSAVDDVTLGDVTIRDARVSVADRRITVVDISATGGKVLAWLEPDGTFSLSRLAGADAADTAPSIQPTEAAPPPTKAVQAPASAPPVTNTAQATEPVPPATKTQATEAAPPVTETASRNNDRDWQIVLSHINTSGLEMVFEDRGVTPVVPINIAPIDVKLTGYDSAKPGPLTLKPRSVSTRKDC